MGRYRLVLGLLVLSCVSAPATCLFVYDKIIPELQRLAETPLADVVDLSQLDRPATYTNENDISHIDLVELRPAQAVGQLTLAQTQALARELDLWGGKIFILDEPIPMGPIRLSDFTEPMGSNFFAVDTNGRPFLIFHKNATEDVIAHEAEHFLLWRSLAEEAERRASAAGAPISSKEAGMRAAGITNSGDPTATFFNETRAVAAEMQKRYEKLKDLAPLKVEPAMIAAMSGTGREQIPGPGSLRGFDFSNHRGTPVVDSIRYEYQRSLYPFTEAIAAARELDRGLIDLEIRLDAEIGRWVSQPLGTSRLLADVNYGNARSNWARNERSASK